MLFNLLIKGDHLPGKAADLGNFLGIGLVPSIQVRQGLILDGVEVLPAISEGLLSGDFFTAKDLGLLLGLGLEFGQPLGYSRSKLLDDCGSLPGVRAGGGI